MHIDKGRGRGQAQYKTGEGRTVSGLVAGYNLCLRDYTEGLKSGSAPIRTNTSSAGKV